LQIIHDFFFSDYLIAIKMETENNEDMDKKEQHLQDIPMSKFQILKNVVAVSFGFLFLFTSFQSLTNLQSTLNKDEGIGTGGLSIIYGTLVISCMFVPSFVISHIGCKWTIAASMVCYVLYMAANFHAVWGLIVPANSLVWKTMKKKPKNLLMTSSSVASVNFAYQTAVLVK
jgi:hypothetical protein